MAEKRPTETPMMKQFFAVKAEHPEAVLLFRCGDFYETYGDDALTASKVLGVRGPLPPTLWPHLLVLSTLSHFLHEQRSLVPFHSA